ncbi:rhomboid family intramembrane serine protease [Leisingera sp. NJS204]|uniref:rhomboid family intramembrane serine protease n=1 Tax=Leisingera sp. NJS204 TaxID=2508307 RepID=UPI0010111687|nr:rhomboid family intramembrane serine protease [Leisingera sp. NJS204]QAX29101.1 rhomboid family intramembrane serine protease [Leisingera sp. NJS204]
MIHKVGYFLLVSPASLGFNILILWAYLYLGPVSGTVGLQSFAELLAGVLRHGSVLHLAVNALIIALAGWQVEPRLGHMGTVLLMLACTVLGTGAELVIVGPGFAGASGVAYGLGSYAALSVASKKQRPWLLLWGAVLLAAELHFADESLAIYSHAVSAALGGVFFMFENLFGTKAPALKPMVLNHLSRVVEIIAQTDEDDAAEAEAAMLSQGVSNMFILKQGSSILGVTGYTPDTEADGVAWLSWTYLDQDCAGQGLGRQMMSDLLQKLTDSQMRKLFIETSDYAEDGEQIYAAAHRMYEEFGADLEVRVPDYHEPGEAKMIYALVNHEQAAPPAPELKVSNGIRFTGAEKAPEGDKVAGLKWQETGKGLEGAEAVLADAAVNGARMAVLVLPSDLSTANSAALQSQGFKFCGSLKDFYSLGLQQDWWTCSLPPKDKDCPAFYTEN